MKASELLKKLQQAIDNEGDLDIALDDSDAIPKTLPITVALDTTVNPHRFVIAFSDSFG